MRISMIIGAIALIGAFTTMSFTSSEKDAKETSTITWVGKKVTGQHEGTIQFKSVDVKFDEKGNLTSGSFEVDMTTIKNTDMEGEMAGKLEGHLKSADFFNVEEFPTATFTTKKVNALGKGQYEVSGPLTIKGITKPLTFKANVASTDGHVKTLTAEVVINRAEYDVKYGSGSFFDGLGDKMIYDEFTLNISISKHVH